MAASAEFTLLFYSGAFLLGLLIGSFLNVVIYRVPVMLERSWKSQCQEFLEVEGAGDVEAERFDLAWPPSRCGACGWRIRAYENIPIVSYLFLRGKCSACGTKISIRYPAIELLTGLVFLLCALSFGLTIQAFAACFFFSMLIALAFIDFDHQLLPDGMTLPLLWAGLLLSLGGVFIDAEASIIGAVAGYLLLWVVFHGFRLLTGKEGMGHGDFKLLAAFGAWLGWQALPLIILVSSLVGSVIGIALIATKKQGKNTAIPFGPFLAIGAFVAFFWGDAITAAYFGPR